MQNEVKIHKDLDHPNIVKLYEYFKDENRYYLIMENINGIELFEKVKNNPQGLLEYEVLQHMR